MRSFRLRDYITTEVEVISGEVAVEIVVSESKVVVVSGARVVVGFGVVVAVVVVEVVVSGSKVVVSSGAIVVVGSAVVAVIVVVSGTGAIVTAGVIFKIFSRSSGEYHALL